MLKFPDVGRVTEIIREVTEIEILPRFRNLTDSDIQQKSSATDLVTIADIDAEKAFICRLMAMLPGSTVVAEENAYSDEKIYARLKSDAPVWLIDPLDGTRNFVNGRDKFGVIIALVYRQETIAGWIHDPLQNMTFTAEKGSGAWHENKRLTVMKSVQAENMIGILGRSMNGLRQYIKNSVWHGSAAHGYIDIINNKAHFACYATHPLKPWDHAAGVLMHAEAGGFSALINGQPYTPFPHDDVLLLAPDKASWRILQNLYYEDEEGE